MWTYDYGGYSDKRKDERHVRLRPAERVVARERVDCVAAPEDGQQQDRVGEYPREKQVRADVRIVVFRSLLLLRDAIPCVWLRAWPLVLDVFKRFLVDVVHRRGVDDLNVDLRVAVLDDGAEVGLHFCVLFGTPRDLCEG